MPRKLLIEIQGNKPLNSYGDNHVIAYDANNKNYYVTTAESFFAGQNAKINKMIADMESMNIAITQMANKITDFEGRLLTRVNSFQSETDTKFRDFLVQYQETNARLIAMVKELIGANEEE